MIIKVSHGEVVFRQLTRKIKKTIMKSMFKGQGMDMVSGEVDKMPMENIVEIAEGAFKELCERVTIETVKMVDGKEVKERNEYKYEDLEKLEKDGLFTGDDFDKCEQKAMEMYQGEEVKKN